MLYGFLRLAYTETSSGQRNIGKCSQDVGDLEKPKSQLEYFLHEQNSAFRGITRDVFIPKILVSAAARFISGSNAASRGGCLSHSAGNKLHVQD